MRKIVMLVVCLALGCFSGTLFAEDAAMTEIQKAESILRQLDMYQCQLDELEDFYNERMVLEADAAIIDAGFKITLTRYVLLKYLGYNIDDPLVDITMTVIDADNKTVIQFCEETLPLIQAKIAGLKALEEKLTNK